MLKLHDIDFEIADFVEQQNLLSLRPVKFIFDVGANVGNTVEVYAQLFPAAEIYAFEPYKPAYEQLASRFQKNPRVHPIHRAAGLEQQRTSLHVNEYVDTNSLLPRPTHARRYYAAANVPRGMTPVEVIRLDDFAREQGVEKIDLLKLDIQGGESAALRGASRLLKSGAIAILYCEVFFVPHYEGALLFHELSAQLADFDYTVYTLRHLVHGQNGQLRFADALYVSPEMRAAIDRAPEEQ